MPTLTIDGEEIAVEAGLTVLQACELAGKEIPRFCYHERLSVAGNCRMCLVEVSPGPPKPAASCALPVADGMEVKTDSDMVRKARQGVMEFLLINHPLDCPICDQGGECDLQDQAMAYGNDGSRFLENKRAVEDKDLGPLIKTIMTRCIHCTRCIRFATEVAGVPELGATGRGENMEVGTYVEKALSSELSGNMIDLCPVGALTSKPYAFTARSWELKKTESIDVLDAVGSNIRIDTRGPEVMRILPRNNDGVNEEWISDKARFGCDGLRRQRLDKPYLRKDGKLQPVDWPEALSVVGQKLAGTSGDKIAAIAGDLADAEAMLTLKELMDSLASPNIDCRQDGTQIGEGPRVAYLFNSTIDGIEDADALLIVGSNPRLEAPVLNARIRKRYLMGGFPVGLIGENVDPTYKVEHLGAGPDTLQALIDGSIQFADVMKGAERPMIVVGTGALARPDGPAILAQSRKLAETVGAVSGDWNGFNVLQRAASRIAGLDIGFRPGDGGRRTKQIIAGAARGDIEVVYLLGADEIDTSALGNAFVIYQGHHGDAGAHRADAILPGAAYTEKEATYVNVEGRAQQTKLAIFPPGEAKEDWAIIRALSESAGKKLPYDSLEQVRTRLADVHPVFANTGEVTPAEWEAFGIEGKIESAPFENPITDFYLTDVISRASETMAECTAAARGDNPEKTGTDG